MIILIKISKKLFWIHHSIYLLLIVMILFGCDKEVSKSPIEPEAPKGFIYVDSSPRGFTIFVGDRNTGRVTPDSISYIEPDQYEITLKKKYFKDTSVVVPLGEDEKKNLFIDILSNPSMYGDLSLTTTPAGASITINDSLVSQVTPAIFENLLPGDYSVKLTLFNHRDKDVSAIVKSGISADYTETLRDTSVWIDFQVFNSGIQSNALTAIAVDQNNVKWIGSLDKGVIRYDEIDFINFNTTNSPLPVNRINCISIDQQNRVWVGTDFGIGVYDDVGWTIYNRNNSGLTAELINTIVFDNLGNAWIGTSANLVKYDGINWTVYQDPNEYFWINSIYITSENDVWLGTTLDGIYKFDNGIYSQLLQPNYGYLSTTISSSDIDEFDNIWFCFLPDTTARGGISVWNGSTFENYMVGSAQNNVRIIFIDDSNNKWIATSEFFAVYDAQNNINYFRTTNSLISSNITNACIRDLSGNVWITTFASGLNKYKPPR